ncbi:MAG TPA: hypothetical protein GXX29_07090 [Firmicutes bacterium]|nr:hypothetical protein [Bacillota bacterium]
MKRATWKNTILIMTSAVLMVLSLISLVAAAMFEWSVKPVTSFTMPAGNTIAGSDLSGDIPRSFVFGYEWAKNRQLDNSTFLTGNGSVLMWHNDGERGRVYIDFPVDGDKKLKFGFVVKTEDLKLAENGSWLRWGIYIKDGLGAWVDMNALKDKPEELGGMLPNGIVTYTPAEVDLGDGPKPITGTNDWFLVEIVVDLPKLAAELQAGMGIITSVRIDQTLYYSSGKVWVDCIYAVPVD